MFVGLCTFNIRFGHLASCLNSSRMTLVPRIRIAGIHLTRITRLVNRRYIFVAHCSSSYSCLGLVRLLVNLSACVCVCLRVCMCAHDWHYASVRRTSSLYKSSYESCDMATECVYACVCFQCDIRTDSESAVKRKPMMLGYCFGSSECPQSFQCVLG